MFWYRLELNIACPWQFQRIWECSVPEVTPCVLSSNYARDRDVSDFHSRRLNDFLVETMTRWAPCLLPKWNTFNPEDGGPLGFKGVHIFWFGILHNVWYSATTTWWCLVPRRLASFCVMTSSTEGLARDYVSAVQSPFFSDFENLFTSMSNL